MQQNISQIASKQIMMAMVSEAVRLAPPKNVDMCQIPKSSEQYLRHGSRRTRNLSAHYDDNSVPYLEPTRHTPASISPGTQKRQQSGR
jgi:hypothetical protein